MNSEQFLQEVLDSDLCPAGFSEIYEQFQQYQQAALKTLREFHRVCEKNGVDYQLAFGSLLGAVRDGGQIPWDYDVDVIVPYEQKDKLVEALKKDLDEAFYFYCPDVAPKCRHYMMRLAPVEYRSEVLHVDVFYCAGLPDDQQQREQNAKCLNRLYRNRYRKLVKFKDGTSGRLRSWVMLLLRKLSLCCVSVSRMDKEFEHLSRTWPLKGSTYCKVIGSNNLIFDTEMLWETELIETNEGTLRITKNYETLLQMIYKDYRRIYPLESRLAEMMGHYNQLTRSGCQKGKE